MKESKTATIVQIPGNIIGVDASRNPYKMELCYAEGLPLCKYGTEIPNWAECRPILFSTVRIDPEIPLVREEDVIVTERFKVDKRADDIDEYYILRSDNVPICEVYDQKTASIFCDFLNSREQGVDVERLAEKEYPGLDEIEIGDPELFGHKSWVLATQQQAFIAGYNAAPKFGYSEGQVRRAYKSGVEYTNEQHYGDEKSAPSIEEFMKEIRKPRYKETVEIEMLNDSLVLDGECVKLKQS